MRTKRGTCGQDRFRWCGAHECTPYGHPVKHGLVGASAGAAVFVMAPRCGRGGVMGRGMGGRRELGWGLTYSCASYLWITFFQ